MKFFAFLFIIILSGCTATKNNHDIDYSKSNERYAQLLKKIKLSATQDDFIEIRKVYIQTEYYQPYTGPERILVGEILAAINREDWTSCLEKSEALTPTNYISLGGHYGAMVCSYESGDEEKGKFHKYVLNNLLDAIWTTGDGKTPETAFYCTSTPELQAFLLLQGLETMNQTLVHHEGKAFDLMEVKNPKNGEEFSLYFDISAQWTQGFKAMGI